MKKNCLTLFIGQNLQDFNLSQGSKWQAYFDAGQKVQIDRSSSSDQLISECGITHSENLPWANWLVEKEGLKNAEEGYWFRADPVYFHADLTSLVLFSDQHFQMTEKEADQLIAELQVCFREYDASLTRGHRNSHWYVRWPGKLNYKNVNPSRCDGQDLRDWQGRGEDRKTIMALCAEVQMILHDSPINQNREAEGKLPINAIWPWGVGIEETLGLDVIQQNKQRLIISRDLMIEVLAEKLNARYFSPDTIPFDAVCELAGENDSDLFIDLNAPQPNESWRESYLESLSGLIDDRKYQHIVFWFNDYKLTLQHSPWWRFWS